jgi:hypothetical protein
MFYSNIMLPHIVASGEKSGSGPAGGAYGSGQFFRLGGTKK